MTDLFSPINIGSLTLNGRLVKSATVETRCTLDGFVTDALLQFYREIAQGGTPLIITGAASYNRYSRGVPHQISVDSDDKIAGLKSLADTVHDHGSKIMVQLYHTGRQAIPDMVGREDAQAPSPVYEPSLGVRPRSMTVREIQQSIREFADAAERCQRAGFDGIQIHAAHGYLISSFLTPHTNRREDDYGGCLENRMRFLLEAYDAVRERVGDDYPIILKINGSDDLPCRRGLSTSELVAVAKQMELKGVDAVEVTAGHYESGMTFQKGRWRRFMKTVTRDGAGKNLPILKRTFLQLISPLLDLVLNRVARFTVGFNGDYARQFSEALNIPVICVGGYVKLAEMNQAISDQHCDMISSARALIADPYLYRNMKAGITGPQCDYCNHCIARGGSMPVACYNPRVAEQRRVMLKNV